MLFHGRAPQDLWESRLSPRRLEVVEDERLKCLYLDWESRKGLAFSKRRLIPSIDRETLNNLAKMGTRCPLSALQCCAHTRQSARNMRA
jgi:hypothetical protein